MKLIQLKPSSSLYDQEDSQECLQMVIDTAMEENGFPVKMKIHLDKEIQDYRKERDVLEKSMKDSHALMKKKLS